MDYQDNVSLTYRRLRRIIGYLGIFLPVILVLASIFGTYVKLQPSISHYYYTNMREVFTGILCAVGLFLIRYQGFGNEKWWKNDTLLTNIAGFMAFGVALIPTNPEIGMDKVYSLVPIDKTYLGYIHYGFAGVLFTIFAMMSLFVFTIGQNRDKGVPSSILDENNIYRLCGILILLFVVLVPLSGLLFPNFKYSTFLFEALSLFTFGISWLIKGRALGDKGVVGEKIYGERNL